MSLVQSVNDFENQIISIDNQISNLQRDEQIVRASGIEAFSKAKRLPANFEARFNAQGIAEINRADNILNQIKTLQMERIKLENQKQALENQSISEEKFDTAIAQPAQTSNNNLRNLLLIGGALLFL